MGRFFFAAAVLPLLLACAPGKNPPERGGAGVAEPAALSEEADPAGSPPSVWKRALEIAQNMDDATLAAQTIMTGIDGKETFSDGMKALFRDIPVGGVLLFKYNLDMPRERIPPFLQEISRFFESRSGAAPFLAVDHEGGYVHRFGPGVERLPPPLDYWTNALEAGWEGAIAQAEEDAARSAAELASLGINLNLAPVAETLTPENRDFLEERSYGPDPAFVEEAVSAFIRGMGRGGLLCAVKHFPGHTGTDPHDAPSALAGDRESLDRKIRPLGELISSGKVSIMMVSHVLVPAWDPAFIASLSPGVIGEWLRKELGFQGLVLADDFSMAAASGGMSPENAVIRALNAGVDMVMAWPMNVSAIHGAILQALERGELSRDRLEEAAARILAIKLRAGMKVGKPPYACPERLENGGSPQASAEKPSPACGCGAVSTAKEGENNAS